MNIYISFSNLSTTCSDAVDSVTSLYNHVEEQAHILVQRSNMSLEHLEYLLQVRELEEHFTQVLYITQTDYQIFLLKTIGFCFACINYGYKVK